MDWSGVLRRINQLVAVAIPGAALPEDTDASNLAERVNLLTAGRGNQASLSSRMPTGRRGGRSGRQAGPTRAEFAAQFLVAGYTPEQANRMAAGL